MEAAERTRQIQLIPHLLHALADHRNQLRSILCCALEQRLQPLLRLVRLVDAAHQQMEGGHLLLPLRLARMAPLCRLFGVGYG